LLAIARGTHSYDANANVIALLMTAWPEGVRVALPDDQLPFARGLSESSVRALQLMDRCMACGSLGER